MTELIFSFDTEDFTSNTAADSIRDEARILREEGVRGCFLMVGLLARSLEKWQRDDVIEELKHHEVGLHSYGHTLHPTINEYTDVEDFSVAYNLVMKEETLANELVKRVAKRDRLYAACPPGNQKNYVAMYAYRDMGIPIYTDTLCDTADGDGAYYCNIYQIRYTFMMESLLFKECSDDDLKQVLDELALKKRAVIFTHPNNVLFSQAWDEQFYKYNRTEFDCWVEGERRPIEDSMRFYENFRRLVRMVKNDKRFKITTYSEIAERLESEPERRVTVDDVPEIRRRIEERLYPISSPLNLSLSDIFYSCVDLLCGKKVHKCEKVYGLLYQPYAITEPLTVHAGAIRDSAKSLSYGFIPEKVKVAGVDLGPADWLRAALAILSGEESYTIMPKENMPSLDAFPRLDTISFKGGWMQSDEFMDNYVSDRLRLQSWTMRFPEI